MIVKLLTEHHLEFLSLKGGCTGSSESTLVKMSNCWKSRALAHFFEQSDTICLQNDKLTSKQSGFTVYQCEFSIFEPRHMISNNVEF